MINKKIKNNIYYILYMVIFHLIDIVGRDVQKNEDNEEEMIFGIHMYGRTEDNKTVYIEVLDFKPFFYIEYKKEYGNYEVLLEDLKNRSIRKYKNDIIVGECKIEKHYKFNEFNNNEKLQFLKLVFENYDAFRYYGNKLKKPFKIKDKEHNFQLMESNIHPIVKFLHVRQLKSCGVIRIDNATAICDKKKSICDIEINTTLNNIFLEDKKLISKIKILSYDIECTSKDGSFPLAKRDPILMIGSTLSIYGEEQCCYQNIITLKTCDPIEGVDIVCCDTEKQLLLAWKDLIQRLDPDIIVTYNGYGFDNKYVYDRAGELGLTSRFMKMNRINGIKSTFVDYTVQSKAMGQNLVQYITMEGRIQIDLMKIIQRNDKLDSYKLDNVANTYIREKILSYTCNKENNKTTLTTVQTSGLEIGRFIHICMHDGLSENIYGRDKKFTVLDKKQKEIVIDGTIENIESQDTLYWSQAKDDIKPQEIFDSYKGTSIDRSRIAKYCVQDCRLCNILVHKLNIINNYVGMANVCNVPLAYVLLRGQGIRTYSLIAERCLKNGYLIPLLKKKELDVNLDINEELVKLEDSVIIEKIQNIGEKNNKIVLTSEHIFGLKTGNTLYIFTKKLNSSKFDKLYETGFVIAKLQDKKITLNTDQKIIDIYKFKSDQKNKIEYYWICEDSSYEGATVFDPKGGVYREPVFVLDFASLYPSAMIMNNLSHECYVNNKKYLTLDDEKNYVYNKINAKIGANKIKEVTFVEKQQKKGIVPEILMDLLKARASVREEMKTVKDKFLLGILDGLQYAYKVIANSVYGGTGASISAVYKKEIAAATTATGRDMLIFASEFVSTIVKYLFNCDDKIQFNEYLGTVLQKGNVERIKNKQNEIIDKFWDDFQKISDKKYIINPEVIYGDSVTGETPMLLRYQVNGQYIITIKTINTIGNEWKEYERFKSEDSNLLNKECDNNIKYEVWTDKGWSKIKRVIRHKTNKKIYEILTLTSYVQVTEDHSLLSESGKILKPNQCKIGTKLLHAFPGVMENSQFYDDSEDKIIPESIFNKTNQEKEDFLKCCCDYTCEIKTQINAMKMYYLLRSLGYNVSISIKQNDSDIFKLTYTKNNFKRSCNAIKNISELNIKLDYVYDLETEAGHFHAGVGQMIVKNTDSIFVIAHFEEKAIKQIINNKEILGKSISLGMLCSNLMFYVLRTPMKIEYEKTFWPLCLLKKKKYVGNLYEKDVNKCYQKNMGIVLKRRDNAPIVKILCGRIIKELLNNNVTNLEINIRQMLQNVIDGKYPLEKFVITKTLRETYKNRSGAAHAVLADRIARRDPMNHPIVNDRIPFVYIYNGKTEGKVDNKNKKKQSEMVEHPDFIREQNLVVDYIYYVTNQIMKPAKQFLILTIDPTKIFNDVINIAVNRRNGVKEITQFFNDDIFTDDSGNNSNNDSGNNSNNESN